jgi:two-component system KDP operon response regulator KdpE
MDVSTAPSGNAALAALDRGWPALLVVDLMMPGMDGFELCRRVKRIADLPIIVLSSVDASEAKVRALEEYAEDYITKPFDPDELVARINRVMRRASSGPGTLRLDDGELELDLAARKAVTPAGTQQLTPTEVRLLQVLVANIDRPVSTEMLLDRVWSDADGADPSYVWVSMRRLRRKLELDPDNPRYLLTERGVGYRLVSTG